MASPITIVAGGVQTRDVGLAPGRSRHADTHRPLNEGHPERAQHLIARSEVGATHHRIDLVPLPACNDGSDGVIHDLNLFDGVTHHAYSARLEALQDVLIEGTGQG